MALVGFTDIDWSSTTWAEVAKKKGDDFDEKVYFLECFEESHKKYISGNFMKTVEIYLLSLLLFVCLLIEMKEYMSVKGFLVYNIITVVYYVVECVTFFFFVSESMENMEIEENYDYSFSMLNSMNEPTNMFIKAIFYERLIIGVACLVLIYFAKETNSTEYIAPDKIVRTINESLSFFIIIGLSSVLAVIVLGVYLKDDSEPGEFVVAEGCGRGIIDTWIDECGAVRADMRDRVCDDEWRNSNWAFLKELFPEEKEIKNKNNGFFKKICAKCGVTLDETSYSFYKKEERKCISDNLGNKQEDNVDSFILAYSASYLFFLVLLHGERGRFQSTRGWYVFRCGTAMMLFSEAVAFAIFRNNWNKVKQDEILFSNPRPMIKHIKSLIIAIAAIRFSVLVMMFIMEQYEVGCSYCRCFWGCCKYEKALPEGKDVELAAKEEGSDLETEEAGERVREPTATL